MYLADETFKRTRGSGINNYYKTSDYGPRESFNANGTITSTFHFGTDYGTHGNNWELYALEDGVVMLSGIMSNNTKCVVVNYPRIKKQLEYNHLSTISVLKGDIVKQGTLLGRTGMTGPATGVHLHLGVIDTVIGKYEDPEKYNYVKENTPNPPPSGSFLGPKGWFGYGDYSPNIAKIAEFMYRVFPLYTSKDALGDWYGPNLKASIAEFQRRTGLEADGNVGPITLAELKKYGFQE